MFSLKDKEKQGPVIALFMICVIVFVFVWRFALSDPPTDTVPRAVIRSAPDVNFEYLDGPEVEYFVDYEKIEPLDEGLMGRENPFSSY